MEEHGGVGLLVQLRQNRVGERAVRGLVALVPRVVKRGIDLGCVRELPQRVVDEPQHRVRDDVVVPVVRLGLVRDEA